MTDSAIETDSFTKFSIAVFPSALVPSGKLSPARPIKPIPRNLRRFIPSEFRVSDTFSEVSSENNLSEGDISESTS